MKWITIFLQRRFFGFLFCLLFIMCLTISSGCNIPKDISIMRERTEQMEADTKAIADQIVTDPGIRQERKNKRENIPPHEDGLDFTNIIMLIISAFLGISATKHSGQMLAGIGRLLGKGKGKS